MSSSGVVDCLVLSGGGAKGAYGAGVAKALASYRAKTQAPSSLCYIGTSAGALNAAVLASADADALIRFWLQVTPRAVLSARIRSPRLQAVMHAFTRRRFFSIYGNAGLRKLISQAVSLGAVQQRSGHLIIAATNYTRGELRAFYVSSLIDQFVAFDDTLPLPQRRLAHFRRIDKQETLERSLLASASIPVFFPAVQIENDWYVDGGIGNHTPTREAAYFLRYLADRQLGIPGEVYCVKHDPPSVVQERGKETFRATEIFKRTLEIYHHLHTEPIVRAWGRINDEVRHHDERIARFDDWLSKQSVPPQLLDDIKQHLQHDLGTLGEATARQDRELVEIQPSSDLGDTLDFDPERIRATINRGYTDMCMALNFTGRINTAEYRDLVKQKPV